MISRQQVQYEVYYKQEKQEPVFHFPLLFYFVFSSTPNRNMSDGKKNKKKQRLPTLQEHSFYDTKKKK